MILEETYSHYILDDSLNYFTNNKIILFTSFTKSKYNNFSKIKLQKISIY